MSERLRRLKARLLAAHPCTRLTPIDPRRVEELRQSFPGIPEGYLELLAELGWETIGECQFMLYEGPIQPADVFGRELPPSLQSVLLVGDDFAGHHAAYDTGRTPWRFVEIEHTRPADVSAGPHDLITYVEAWWAE